MIGDDSLGYRGNLSDAISTARKGFSTQLVAVRPGMPDRVWSGKYSCWSRSNSRVTVSRVDECDPGAVRLRRMVLFGRSSDWAWSSLAERCMTFRIPAKATKWSTSVLWRLPRMRWAWRYIGSVWSQTRNR